MKTNHFWNCRRNELKESKCFSGFFNFVTASSKDRGISCYFCGKKIVGSPKKMACIRSALNKSKDRMTFCNLECRKGFFRAIPNDVFYNNTRRIDLYSAREEIIDIMKKHTGLSIVGKLTELYGVNARQVYRAFKRNKIRVCHFKKVSPILIKKIKDTIRQMKEDEYESSNKKSIKTMYEVVAKENNLSTRTIQRIMSPKYTPYRTRESRL